MQATLVKKFLFSQLFGRLMPLRLIFSGNGTSELRNNSEYAPPPLTQLSEEEITLKETGLCYNNYNKTLVNKIF